MRKKILFDEKEFKKIFPVMLNSGLAKRYGVTESAIRRWGASLGLNKAGVAWSPYEENYILTHYKKGRYTVVDIAEHLKRTRWAVINKYRELKRK